MKKLYVNTENKNDIVTLEEIRKRYFEINGTEEGFQKYVNSEFSDGMTVEYTGIK